MSEFTNGILFLNQHLDEMNKLVTVFDTSEFAQSFASDWANLHVDSVPSHRKKFAERTQIDYMIHQVNEKWSALLLEDFVQSFTYGTMRQWLYETSNILPIIVFNHGEDHGWTYSLLRNGAIVSQADVNYEILWYLAYDYLEAKYPHLAGDTYELFEAEDIPTLYKKIRQTVEYQQSIEKMYRDHHAEQFAVFNLTDEQVSRLKIEISAEKFKDSFESMKRQLDNFLKILQLEEVSWMSYRYMKKGQQGDE